MSAAGGDGERGPGHHAALEARNAVEAALFSMPDIPLAFDRAAVKDRLLRAIQCAYAVLDSPVIAAVHFDGLNEAAAIVAEACALLARAGDRAAVLPLGRALAGLEGAEATLRRAGEAVAQIQLARRTELVGGGVDGLPPPAQPFRASVGLPELHAIARPPLLPHVEVDPAAPIPDPPAPPVALPRPKTLEELGAFAAAAASGEIARRFEEPEEPAPDAPKAPAPFVYEPAVGDAEVLRRLGRDCLEDIAAYRSLRKPNAIESWLDQEPFEQRLLDNIDAFAALGGSVLPLVSLFNAEAKAPDPERAFAVALTLGCIAGSDTVGAAVMTLKQSAPETFPGWIEGFWLAPNPAIDRVMADLCTGPRADLAALALDVLHARGSTTEALIQGLIERPEPAIAARVARALGAVMPREEAIVALETICAATADDATFLAATEALLRRRHPGALDLLRHALDAPATSPRAAGALRLLCLAGGASDLEALLAGLHAAPSATLLRGIGRFGHADALTPLVNYLYHDDAELVAAAAEALERITGAGLRETVEEEWEIDLPPGAVEAGAAPVPTRKVDKVVVDPAAWTRWLERGTRRLDTRTKLRAGAPFSPLQIVDELESRATPPDRRGEAALELGVLTGIASPFSPDDWVARQRVHLADLRARAASPAAAQGVWRAVVPRARPSVSAAIRADVAPAPADLPIRESAPAAAPDAWGAAPPAGDTAPRPPLVTMPDAQRRLDDALPFRQPAVEPASPWVSDAARAPAENVTMSMPAWPYDAGDGTQPPSTVPEGLRALARQVLPFRPADPSEPVTAAIPPVRAPASDLPFGPNAAPAAPPAEQPPPAFTLDQYAALCAELSASPQTADAIFARYGLATQGERLGVDLWWRERLRRNHAEYEAWREIYQRYHAYWIEQARRGGRT